MQTNTNKLLAGAMVAGMIFTGTAQAATIIGSGTVAGSGALTTDVTWNDSFPGTATGTINGLVIKGRVLPVLNMAISGSGEINFGNLTSAAYSSGSVNIEVGTNATNGASVTAKSSNGGMKNASNPTYMLNNLTTDEVADSYRFTSALDAAEDSSYGGFTQGASLTTEVADNTTSHVLYTSNKPQKLDNVDDFTFTVSAKPDIETPAGDYSDVVVVTVTGNF